MTENLLHESIALRLRANAYALGETIHMEWERQLVALLLEAAKALDPNGKTVQEILAEHVVQ